MTETYPNTKMIWEQHLNIETAHLHKAAEMLMKYENKDWRSIVTAEFPKLLKFEPQKAYVRQVLHGQINQTADMESYKNIDSLPQYHRFFKYQDKINGDTESVASHKVIMNHIQKYGTDYRYEESPNPVKSLRNRQEDCVKTGRTQELYV